MNTPVVEHNDQRPTRMRQKDETVALFIEDKVRVCDSNGTFVFNRIEFNITKPEMNEEKFTTFRK